MRLSDYENYSDAKDYLLFVKRRITENGTWRKIPHMHNGIEFAVCTKGCFYVEINEKQYEMREGSVAFVNRFERHRYLYMTGAECFIVVISTSLFNSINELKRRLFPTWSPAPDRVQELIAFLEFSITLPERESLLFKHGFVNMLTALLVQCCPAEIRPQGANMMDTMGEIVQYISNHFREDISIHSLAERFGYSPNYLSTAFNQYMGGSFRDYLNLCRIAEYSKLIEEQPGLGVGRAAALCGFQTPATFYTALKKAKAQKHHTEAADPPR